MALAALRHVGSQFPNQGSNPSAQHWKAHSFSFYKFIYVFMYLFIYLFNFWLRWVFVAARRLSLVVASRGYSSLQCAGFSLRWLLLLWSTGSRSTGFSSCGMRAQQLWHTGLVALQHVGPSWTRAQTHVSYIGRRILHHCATREARKAHS